MRIGVDATCWQNTRGYGRHARGLLSALVRIDRSNRYVFFFDSEEHLPSLPGELRVVRNSVPTAVAAAANGHRSALDIFNMSRAMSAREFDLLLFPTIYSYVPVFSRAKKLVTIHDVIAEKFPALTVPRSAARILWKTKVALGLRQADVIVTVSEYSRKGIAEHFGLPSERVLIVGEACDSIFRILEDPQPTDRLQSLGIVKNDRYIVYVGGFSPHKNLASLVAAFAKASSQSEFADVRLVMVGEHEKDVFHTYFDTISQLVEDLGVTGRVIFTGYLPDDELVILLNLSKVLVLPSLMEGFGLPAIEAAACGCPVIATRESPLPTLLGESALYIDPKCPEKLLGALISVLGSDGLRRSMSAAGCEAAARFTWEAAAKQMISVMNQVAMQ